MKRSILLPLSVIVGLFVLFFATSCKEPIPNPTPDPTPTPTPTPTPAADKFVPIYELNDNNELKAIPMPLLDFKAHLAEVQKWEEEHGSTPLKEPTASGNEMIYSFFTKDPKIINPTRSYVLDNKGKGLLKTAMVVIKFELIFAGDPKAYADKTQKPKLSDHMEELLMNSGYRAVDENRDSFVNGTYMLLFATSKIGEETYATILYAADPNQAPPGEKFDPEALDFPLVSIPMEELTAEKIAAHEAKTNRILHKGMSTDSRFVYYTAKDNQSNFQIVTYVLAEEGNTKPSITAQSRSITEDMFLSDESVARWFKLNNLSMPVEKNGMYTASSEHYMYSIAFPLTGTLLIFLPKSVAPVPTAKNYEYMMPILKFGKSFAKDDEIWKDETNRGNDCEFKTDDNYGDFMIARPGSNYPETAFKVSGFYYFNEEYEGDSKVVRATRCDAVSAEFTDVDDKGDSDRVKAFMKEMGFEYTGTWKASYGQYKDRWGYENKTTGMEAVWDKNNGPEALGLTIRPLGAEGESASVMRRRAIRQHDAKMDQLKKKYIVRK